MSYLRKQVSQLVEFKSYLINSLNVSAELVDIEVEDVSIWLNWASPSVEFNFFYSPNSNTWIVETNAFSITNGSRLTKYGAFSLSSVREFVESYLYGGFVDFDDLQEEMEASYELLGEGELKSLVDEIIEEEGKKPQEVDFSDFELDQLFDSWGQVFNPM